MKKPIIQISLGLLFACALFSFLFYRNLSHRIDQAIQTGWFQPSVEFYSAPFRLDQIKKHSLSSLKKKLIQRNYTSRMNWQKLKSGEFIILQKKCRSILKTSRPVDQCLIWIQQSLKKQAVGFYGENTEFFEGELLKKTDSLELEPVLFAQYEGESPHIRRKFKLGEAPYSCLQSITLTEDKNFLLHKGASLSSIVRALIRNLRNIRIREGGSTITQQLIKNRFLSSEKTFQRKWMELVMSIILETKLSKDQILELYMNTVYMGQSGAYSLFGFHSAGRYYFNKPLSKLNTPQCALLSALVQSPGRWNPFLHPEKAKKRRNFILKKMALQKIISKSQLNSFIDFPLPSQSSHISMQTAPYFIQAVQMELKKINIQTDRPLKIYTTIDLKMQSQAEKAIKNSLSRLDKNPNKTLQAGLICVDLKTNKVVCLAGGRNFLQSQFNRALQARRPIGSLVKPFIYLSALADPSLNPLSLIEDSPLEKNSWSPKNYKNKYYGFVPLYFALKESLNTVSVRLGEKAGLKQIVKDFSKLGFKRKALPVSSLTLGAVDMSPLEVSQMYSTIARMGSHLPLSFVDRITADSGSIVYQSQKQARQKFSKQKTAVLIGMMKQVIQSGTAKWIRPFWPHPTAGKTGTSNDERDSWFVGFTPELLTTVWLGYDDNTPHQLTGSGGALPVWLTFMQSIKNPPVPDFPWPKKVEIKKASALSIQPLKSKNIKLFSVSEDPSSSHTVDLIVEKKSLNRFKNIFKKSAKKSP